MSIAGYSQAGALSIVNNNPKCGVWIVMIAQEPLGGYPRCSLQGNQFFVPTSTTTSFPSHGAFTSAVGWLIGSPGPAAPATDFTWNECRFQFVCPLGPPCSSMGSWVNTVFSTIFNCNMPRNGITSGGTCVTGITWSPDPMVVMDNVTVTFN
ncbi:MAG: hypothetical protein H7257_12755 [Taibaiella sp.]|nr:hypothetical protein [Taibaiella sp.]